MRNPSANAWLSLILLAPALLGQFACGGGGGGSRPAAATPQTPPPAQFNPGVFGPSSNFSGMCANPRIGPQFPDAQGTSTDENNWLRSWSNELYLWYDEIVDRNPASYGTPQYFDLLKTPATTQSGAPKDQFHFTIPSAEWEALSQSGVSAGYGARFIVVSPTPPREIVIAYVTPNSPAAAAGLTRGTKVLEVDGVSVVNGADSDALNAGLFPSAAAQDHVFMVEDPFIFDTETITLQSALITEDPVEILKLFDTPTGPVGHLFFTQHTAPAEQELIDAIETLAAAGVTDLILDIRYNGGGFLDIANELAYMIAGGAAASGRVFSELQFNDKYTAFNPVTGEALAPDFFHTTTQGFSTTTGEPLPTLNLSRVFVLTTGGTCSASETIINGLRGVDFEVIQIGSGTCGKPYGFYAPDNCGTTYFSIQFRSVNAKGFGDYPGGFAPQNLGQAGAVSLPGCAVADDLHNPIDVVGEAHFTAAMGYLEGSGCPAVPTSLQASTATNALSLPKAGSTSGAIAAPSRAGAVKRR